MSKIIDWMIENWLPLVLVAISILMIFFARSIDGFAGLGYVFLALVVFITAIFIFGIKLIIKLFGGNLKWWQTALIVIGTFVLFFTILRWVII